MFAWLTPGALELRVTPVKKGAPLLVLPLQAVVVLRIGGRTVAREVAAGRQGQRATAGDGHGKGSPAQGSEIHRLLAPIADAAGNTPGRARICV